MGSSIRHKEVTEIIEAGYGYDALDQNIITPYDIVIWLVSQKCSENTLVAYRCVCILADHDDHYINNKHITIILHNIEYLLIYILSGGSDNTLAEKNSTTTVLERRAHELVSIYRSKSRHVRLRTLCNLEASERFKHLQLLTGSQNVRPAHRDLDDYFRYQRFDLIKEVMTADDFNVLVKYAILTSNKYHNLWTNHLQDIYYQIASKFYAEGLPESITKKTVDDLNSLFPGLIPEDISSLSLEAFNISRYRDHMVKAYLLGFPIHHFIPSHQKIHQALMELTELGSDEYYAQMIDKQPGGYKDREYDIQLFVHNDHNSYGVPINAYVAFDTIHFVEDNQIYYFTRPEFHTLLDNGKNIWKNTPLSYPILAEVQKRINIVEKYNLPEATSTRSSIHHEIRHSAKHLSNSVPISINHSDSLHSDSNVSLSSSPSSIIFHFSSNSPIDNNSLSELFQRFQSLSSSPESNPPKFQ